jgi:hypothetical protein
MFEATLADLRYGLRLLTKTPGFTAVVPEPSPFERVLPKLTEASSSKKTKWMPDSKRCCAPGNAYSLDTRRRGGFAEHQRLPRGRHPHYRQPTLRKLYETIRSLKSLPYRGRPAKKRGRGKFSFRPCLTWLFIALWKRSFKLCGSITARKSALSPG